MVAILLHINNIIIVMWCIENIL